MRTLCDYGSEALIRIVVFRQRRSSQECRRVDGAPRRVLEDRLEKSIQKPRRESGMAEMGEEEKEAFLALLKSMLVFRPGERPSAEQVLGSGWMQKWGMPAIELMGTAEI